MDANEYLERIVAERYEREVDKEENVFRSLPFAATAIAVVFTFLFFVRSSVPNLKIGIYPIAVWLLLACFCADTGLALYFLFRALAPKTLQYLSSPDELYSYVADLRNYYDKLGRQHEQGEQSLTDDIRVFMLEQYVLGATHTDNINVQRLKARTRAFQSLIIALALALVAVVIILAHNAVKGGGGGTIAI